tara:strand:+ start:841 stop:1497 length:657 start_codon:yes stop_codon:yes gene_type:complete
MNQINYDVSKPYVKICTDQETKDKNMFTSFVKAGKKDDNLILGIDELQAETPVNYILDNQYGCEKGLKEARSIQTSQPGINFSGGYGWIAEKGWLVDNDSSLRQNKDRLTNLNEKNQLFERLTLTNPNLVKGYYDVDVESVIQPGNFTTEQRPCGPLSGVSTLDKTLTPMVPKLKKEVQDPIHIIPENSKIDWVRGGLPTRQMIKNDDYLRRYQEKTF